MNLSKYINVSLCSYLEANVTLKQPISSNFSVLFTNYHISKNNMTRIATIALNASCECLNHSLIGNFSDAGYAWYMALMQSELISDNATISIKNSSRATVVQIHGNISQLLPNEPFAQGNGTLTATLSLFCGPNNQPLNSTWLNASSIPNYTTSGNNCCRKPARKPLMEFCCPASIIYQENVITIINNVTRVVTISDDSPSNNLQKEACINNQPANNLPRIQP